MNHSASTILLVNSERNLDTNNIYFGDPSPTTTTTVLIVIIHLLFLHQWNSRKRRKDLLVSYSVIVQKRQFHKLWLALLSHPPTKNSNRLSISTPTHATATNQGGEGATSDAQQQQQFNGNISPLPPQLELRGRLTAVVRQLASWSYQSGFALLLYNSHILWSCRALEGLYDYGPLEDENNNDSNNNDADTQYYYRPLQYARVLLALTTMALLVELRFSYTLIGISKRLMGAMQNDETNDSSEMTIPLHHHHHDPASNTTDHGSALSRMQQKILRRPIGTLTALTCALVTVFSHHFNYISLQVLPFIDNRILFLGFSAPVALTSLMCWGILAYLSYPSHPITPLMSGLMSGGFWVLGLTSFLQDAYWGSCLLVMVLILCCLSLRASDNHTREAMERVSVSRGNNSPLTWIPCVDYVSWNSRGQRVRGAFDDWDPPPPRNLSGGDAVRLTSTTIDFLSSSSSSDDDDDDGDDDTSSDASIYSSHQPARFSDVDDSASAIDDDDDHFVDVPLLPEHHGQTMRARRGLGTTSSSHG